MSFTLELSKDLHDVIIEDGKVLWVNGEAEVRQRIKIALWHYYREYFLNVEDGVPWYEEIMGARGTNSRISNIIRTVILSVPGVLRIEEFEMAFDSTLRVLLLTGTVVVQGNDEDATDKVTLDGLTIAV